MCSPPMTSKRGDDVPPPTKETPCELREHGDPATGSGVGVILCHDTLAVDNARAKSSQNNDATEWHLLADGFKSNDVDDLKAVSMLASSLRGKGHEREHCLTT